MLRKICTTSTKRLLVGVRASNVNPQHRMLSTVASVHIQPKFDDVSMINQSMADNHKAFDANDLTVEATRDNLKGTLELLSKLKADEFFLPSVERRNTSPEYEALMKRQLKVEEEQLVEASAIYQETFEGLAKMGKGSTLKSAQKLLLQWYEPLVAALRKEFDDIAKGVTSDQRNVYGPYLVQLPVEKLAVITLTTTLNCILRSGNIGEKIVRIATDIASVVEAESHMYQMKRADEVPTWQKKFSQTESGRATNARSVNLFNKKLRKIATEQEWATPIKVKVGAKLVDILLKTAQHDEGIASFIYTNNFYQHGHDFAKRMGFVRLDPEKFSEFSALPLKDMKGAAMLMPRFLPMLVPPVPWNNFDYSGAYYQMKAPLMKATSAMQTVAVKRGQMDPVLESLDYLGQIGWRINPLVHGVINRAVEEKISIADIPSYVDLPQPEEDICYRSMREILEQKEIVESKRLARKLQVEQLRIKETGCSRDKADEMIAEAEMAKELREKANSNVDLDEQHFDERYYKYMCNRVNKQNSELHSLRCDLSIKLGIAEKFKDDVMYFPHNIDFRGRAYPIPPNLSHLGADLSRGIMMFDKAKKLGPHGLEWLKIHLSNLFGHNKISLSDRMAWTEAHMSQIRDSVSQPLDGERWWLTAENPFQALAACGEIVGAIDSGNPEEYMCRLPVHQDGSCNGLQHYAGLGRDAQGGSAVNLVPHEKPQDVYSSVLEKVILKVAEDIHIPENDQRALDGKCARLVHGLVSRKVIKQTVMTSVYGVTRSGARAQVEARLHDVFNLDSTTTPEREKEIADAAGYLANLTLVSLAEMFTSARDIMDWLGNCAKLVAQQDKSVSWVTPLGLPVIQPYRKVQIHAVHTVLQTITLAVHSDMLPVSVKKQKSAFPPNFVHSMDATHMMMTSLKMKRLGLNFAAVHDSYWTHPSDIPVLNECLRDAFVELYEQPLLEELLSSLEIRFPDIEFPPIPKRGTLDVKSVKKSQYFFH